MLKTNIREKCIYIPAVTNRRLYCMRLWARPRGFFFLSCLATLGVWPLTLPARAKDPWTFPEKKKKKKKFRYWKTNESPVRDLKVEKLLSWAELRWAYPWCIARELWFLSVCFELERVDAVENEKSRVRVLEDISFYI